MNYTQAFPAVHHISPGVSLLTAGENAPNLSLELLRQKALLIEHGQASAVVFACDAQEGSVLAARTNAVLVREDLLEWLGNELLTDIGGAKRFADPQVALLDAQWRINLLGEKVIAVPHPGADQLNNALDQQEMKGILTMLFTNLGDDWRGPMLSAAQLLFTTGTLAQSGTDTTTLDLQRSPGGDNVGEVKVPAAGLVGSFAVDSFLDDMTETRGVREYVQRIRRVPDRALAGLLQAALHSFLALQTAAEQQLFQKIARLTGLEKLMQEPMHVLIVSAAEGPGKEKADSLAQQLASTATVRRINTTTDLVTQDEQPLSSSVPEHAKWADAIVLSGVMLADAPGVAFTTTPLLVDLSMLDALGWLMNASRTDQRATAFNDLCQRADRVLVADDVQKDILLGAMAGNERVNDVVYDQDPSLETLVAIDRSGEQAVQFCSWPRRAADRGGTSAGDIARVSPTPNDLVLAIKYLREGGVSNVIEKASGRIQRIRASKNTQEGR